MAGDFAQSVRGITRLSCIYHATKRTCRQARSNRSSSYEISGKSFDTWRQADKNIPSDIFLSELIRDFNTRSCLGLHDISLVYRGHPFSSTGLRVVERVSSHAFRRVVSDELDGLNDPINNLKFLRKRAGLSSTKWHTSCSMPEYSPSVFSRMITVLTSS